MDSRLRGKDVLARHAQAGPRTFARRVNHIAARLSRRCPPSLRSSHWEAHQCSPFFRWACLPALQVAHSICRDAPPHSLRHSRGLGARRHATAGRGTDDLTSPTVVTPSKDGVQERRDTSWVKFSTRRKTTRYSRPANRVFVAAYRDPDLRRDDARECGTVSPG